MKSIYQKILSFFTAKPSAPSVIDALDLIAQTEENFKYSLFVNTEGELIYRDNIFNNKVTGVYELNIETKLLYKVNPKTKALDFTLNKVAQ